MNKKILLLYPPLNTHFITPPLGLGYLASYVEKNSPGTEIKLIDCNMEKYSNERLLAEIKSYAPGLVGFTIYTCFFNTTLNLIKAIKADNPGIKIVVGGPHPTALPEDTLGNANIDFVILGEGEETLLELIDNISLPQNYQNIPGLAYKDNGKIRINQMRENIKDLDNIPFPAWHFIPPDKYPRMPHGSIAKKYPLAPVVSSRGCPFLCSFCASEVVWKRKWRPRSPKSVVDEIELLKNEYGVKEIHFEDDNFTLDRNRAIKICEEIIKRKLDIAWSCPNGVRIDTMDEELLQIMKRSGCYSLVFGFESGDPEILKRVNKRLDLSKVESVVRMTKKIGIRTTGFFIIGLPGETKKSILKTVSLAKSLPLDRAQFGLFAPLPGSQDFDLWLKEQKPEYIDWDKFDFYNVIYKLDDLSEEEVKYLQKFAFRAFYMRPRIILNILRDIHVKELIPIIKRLKKIFQ